MFGIWDSKRWDEGLIVRVLLLNEFNQSPRFDVKINMITNRHVGE